MSTTATGRPRRIKVLAILIVAALAAVAVSISFLFVNAVPHLGRGTLPEDPYFQGYVRHPWQALLHVVPGLIYIFGALLQLSAGFRRTRLALHRRLGRILVASGIVAGIFALIFGLSHPFDGFSEASATGVFASWLLVCLVLGFTAAGRRDIVRHRRWMIRAFAVAIGIGTVRYWVAILGGIQSAINGTMPQLSPQSGTFGPAFWLGFGMNVLAGEWWLRRPTKPRSERQAGVTVS